jgi:hypothetical protein
MADDQDLVAAMTLAEEIADKAVRARQDWPAVGRMASELAILARQLTASSGPARGTRD